MYVIKLSNYENKNLQPSCLKVETAATVTMAVPTTTAPTLLALVTLGKSTQNSIYNLFHIDLVGIFTET
jgi:hypothetical protein